MLKNTSKTSTKSLMFLTDREMFKNFSKIVCKNIGKCQCGKKCYRFLVNAAKCKKNMTNSFILVKCLKTVVKF